MRADPPALLDARHHDAVGAHRLLALGGAQRGASPPAFDPDQLGLVGGGGGEDTLEAGHDLVERGHRHEAGSIAATQKGA